MPIKSHRKIDWLRGRSTLGHIDDIVRRYVTSHNTTTALGGETEEGGVEKVARGGGRRAGRSGRNSSGNDLTSFVASRRDSINLPKDTFIEEDEACYEIVASDSIATITAGFRRERINRDGFSNTTGYSVAL